MDASSLMAYKLEIASVELRPVFLNRFRRIRALGPLTKKVQMNLQEGSVTGSVTRSVTVEQPIVFPYPIGATIIDEITADHLIDVSSADVPAPPASSLKNGAARKDAGAGAGKASRNGKASKAASTRASTSTSTSTSTSSSATSTDAEAAQNKNEEEGQ